MDTSTSSSDGSTAEFDEKRIPQYNAGQPYSDDSGQISRSSMEDEASRMSIPEDGSFKPFDGKDLYLEPDFSVVTKRDVWKRPDTSELFVIGGEIIGDKILVLLPTDNPQKVNILKAFFPKYGGPQFVFEALGEIDSGVGQQPYNSAGPQGAINRIVASLMSFVAGTTRLGDPDQYCKDNNIGKIMVASIENYIEGEIVEGEMAPNSSLVARVETPENVGSPSADFTNPTILDPVDYGYAVLYDAIHGEVISVYSNGVSVPALKTSDGEIIDLIALAMSKGFINGKRRHGAQTVGKVIKSLFEPTPNRVNSDDGKPYSIDANWHADVTGGKPDRYSLLYQAAARILKTGIERGVFNVDKWIRSGSSPDTAEEIET